jgi:hypothetical protein
MDEFDMDGFEMDGFETSRERYCLSNCNIAPTNVVPKSAQTSQKEDLVFQDLFLAGQRRLTFGPSNRHCDTQLSVVSPTGQSQRLFSWLDDTTANYCRKRTNNR